MKFQSQFPKILCLGIACLFFSIPAQSQVLISLLFGDKLNNENNYFGIQFNESLNRISNFEETKSLRTFNLGLFFSHRFNEHWMLNVEALPKYRKGADELETYSLGTPELDQSFEGAEIARKINYMGLPVTVRYLVGSRWYVEAGPQLNMRLKAQDIFTVKSESDEIIYKNDVRDQVSKWDFGYILGSGFLVGKQKSKALGIRYHHGVSDVLPDLEGKQGHRQWDIYLNLPVGRGKTEE